MSERLKNKMKYFISILLMIVLLVGIAYLGFMRKMDIDVMKNLEVEYSGENGNATLRVHNSSASIDQRTAAFMETVKYQASPSSGLSNGDKVEITATFDKDMDKQYNFKVIHTTKEITVEDLPNQYGSLAEIKKSYIKEILAEAQDYIKDHAKEIYQVEVDEDAGQPRLEKQTVVYQSFMKSLEDGNSDRILQIVRLDYKNQNENTTLYYMVVVPEINDSQTVETKDIYGLKATMTNEEILEQAFKDYVNRVFSNSYTIEEIEIK